MLQEATSAIRPGQGHSECQDEVLSCRLSPEDGCDLAGAPEEWRLEGNNAVLAHGQSRGKLTCRLVIEDHCGTFEGLCSK